jgi:protein involved in polysaccharide export with SLBB domain
MNTDQINKAMHAKDGGVWLTLSCLVLLFLGWSTLNLFAAPPSDTNSPLLTALTNALYQSQTTMLQTPTNITKAYPTNSLTMTNGMDALDNTHTLAIGDILSFRIVEDEDDPRTMIVTDSGDLEVPYIGRFPAQNLTCKQLARQIKAALEKDYYFQATVIIAVNTMARSRGKVYLVGAIRIPGPEDLPSDEILTLSKAVLRAGGFDDSADRKHVKITREGSAGENDKVTLIVDVGQIFDEGKTEKDVALKPGDLIYIPERLIRF